MNEAQLACILSYVGLTYKDFDCLRGYSVSYVWNYIKEKKSLTKQMLCDLQIEFKSIQQELHSLTHLYPGHRLYPARFLSLKQPPLYLFVEGDVSLLSTESLAVVGSRQVISGYEEWLDLHFYNFLHKSKVSVVSGGAVGIDQLASRIALRAGCSTIILLPSGLGCKYPANLNQFGNHKQVVYLTEYFPRERMQTFHFHRRNQLIAALSGCLFAVQLAVRSGTMITVNCALELGKDVWTLPDFPCNKNSMGNLGLLRDGALMITNEDDLHLAWQLQTRPVDIVFSTPNK